VKDRLSNLGLGFEQLLCSNEWVIIGMAMTGGFSHPIVVHKLWIYLAQQIFLVILDGMNRGVAWTRGQKEVGGVHCRRMIYNGSKLLLRHGEQKDRP